MMQFTLWVNKVKLSDRATWVAGTMKKTTLQLDTMTGDKFFAYWGLEKHTIEFLTHACCLVRHRAGLDPRPQPFLLLLWAVCSLAWFPRLVPSPGSLAFAFSLPLPSAPTQTPPHTFDTTPRLLRSTVTNRTRRGPRSSSSRRCSSTWSRRRASPT